MSKISIVINGDTRSGWLGDVTKIGMHGMGSLTGCRSLDFLTYGVDTRKKFFQHPYHELEVILSIDVHERIPPDILSLLESKCDILNIVTNVDRKRYRWFDYLTINAMALATGDYLVHFDCDVVAFRRPGSNVLDRHLEWLNGEGYKFICQPEVNPDHGMYWASTRYFMCKRETFDVEEVTRCIDNFYLYAKYGDSRYFPCCLEQTLGIMAWDKVFYPPADWSDYMIFSWVHYYKGVLEQLNNSPYDHVLDYIMNVCGGICGPNDVIGKELPCIQIQSM